MKRGGIRKDNRGDSLILVIGCIALLSVLGIVILAKSVDNQTMKMAERSAQESFFAADSTSAEVATVLEAVALEAIEDAFSDMLVEYTNSGDDDTRKERYEQYFETRLDQKLKKDGDNKLEKLLSEALGGGPVSNVSIEYENPVVVTDTDDIGNNKTDIINIKNVKLTYSANGSETTITTDINIQTQIPDVTGGFRSTVDCNFSDFAVIADGAVSLNTASGATVSGNFYTGSTLSATGSNPPVGGVPGAPFTMNIKDASKVLVKGTMQVDGGALINIDNGTVSEGSGPSVWAHDIYVKGGGDNPSMLTTSDMNLYVSDDLAIEGNNSKITMSGTNAEYVGYSGGIGNSSLANYEKSSAITVNNAKNVLLKLAGMKKVVLTGTSYIHEDSWQADDGSNLPGVMQGESVAYKDMQAMYLVPSDCMAEGHNPVMSDTESAATSFGEKYMLGSVEIKWDDYLDSTNPVLTHKLLLDNGATKATYVYLNFKNETMAARYTELYLNSAKGNIVKAQASNLGSSSAIELPTDTYARGTALTYNGSSATIRPATAASNLSMLTSASLNARLKYNGLFTSLQAGAGGTLKPDYKMVADGITSLGSVTANDHVQIEHPVTGNPCDFYLHVGDVTIDGSSDYDNMNGILLVKGNVKIEPTLVNIKGLVLATGTVEIKNAASFTADPEAVEALLAEEDVAKYFKGFGESEQNFLSSEAVDITFENWQRN